MGAPAKPRVGRTAPIPRVGTQREGQKRRDAAATLQIRNGARSHLVVSSVVKPPDRGQESNHRGLKGLREPVDFKGVCWNPLGRRDTVVWDAGKPSVVNVFSNVRPDLLDQICFQLLAPYTAGISAKPGNYDSLAVSGIFWCPSAPPRSINAI